ncbi:MAG: FKBP-type peptidyl-prolyl cis-trans isomerase [Candidatus Pacearchaeota archaeon]
METAKKGDFVEIKYTGYANENIFDSNIEEDLKKIHSKAKAKRLIVCVGEGMVVFGFDKALEGKEVGKEYEIKLSPKEAFGERKKELIKTIPLKIFTEKKMNPQAGMVLAMDEALAKVIAVSGARVITDFNNPLAGKEVTYKFKIERKINDEKEKAEALFDFVFKFVPEFEIAEKEIVVRGQKIIEVYVNAFSKKFEDLLGKKLRFELKDKGKKKEEKANGKENSERKK